MEKLPKIFKIGQKLEGPHLGNLEARLNELMDQFGLSHKVKKGERIGLTAGSRGIRDKPLVLRTIVSRLRDLGAYPFIVPCMGSHGGGTAEGQVEVLASLGITEESMGAPIVSSMDVEEIGQTRFGVPALVDRNLCHADKIVVVNRIKPHTDFEGEFESGLVKMMGIGMGKQKGASVIHRLALKHGFPAVLSEVGSMILGRLPVLCGVGIVENQHGQTALIDVLKPAELVEKEKRLLKEARRLMHFLPFDPIDILIVDEMGKNISGSGMDTNIIGRCSVAGNSKPKRPLIVRIFVRDLTQESHGNATGIGMADYTTKRLIDKIDYPAIKLNCITGMTPEDGRIPLYFQSDEEALFAAYENSGVLDPKDLRIVWIKNTLELDSLFASRVLIDETKANMQLRILNKPFDLPFDQHGNLVSGW